MLVGTLCTEEKSEPSSKSVQSSLQACKGCHHLLGLLNSQITSVKCVPPKPCWLKQNSEPIQHYSLYNKDVI